MITYWAPRAHPGARSPVSLFDFMATPFQPPQHFEAVEVEDDGSSITVEHSLETSGYILIGLSSVGDPRVVKEARQIVDLGSKPDLRSLRQLTVAYF